MSDLILVTLPIGNNKDLTLRAKEILEQNTRIMAEDTRVFREFCKHNGISLEGKEIDSFHDHSDERKKKKMMEWLEQDDVLLVSDAGSPLISDPAFPMIQTALDHGISIKTIPGVSSVIVALELSGLPPTPFHFHAFIPREKGKRKKFSDELGQQYGTHIFFEGVSRVKETLDILTGDHADEQFCIARELTKEYESVHRFTGKQWEEIKNEVVYKGEFVILLHISKAASTGLSSESMALAQQLAVGGVHPKKLSKLLSEITGISPKEVYQNLQKK